MLDNKSYQAVLFDIEGTTTSIEFVKDFLFTYAFAHVDNFLITSFEKKINLDIIDELIQLSAVESKNNLSETMFIKKENENWIHNLSNNIKNWIKNDKKFTALKNLQGKIWQDGYSSGKIKGHVYSDVPTTFERLNLRYIRVYIFSSGSIQAQKLLFSYSEYGDLTKYISDYFDTTIGSKLEANSYEKIVEKIKVPANEILFVTDNEKEASAAEQANLQVVLSIREGNSPLSDEAKTKFRQISSFNYI